MRHQILPIAKADERVVDCELQIKDTPEDCAKQRNYEDPIAPRLKPIRDRYIHIG
jgi:hypothetical protein